MENERIRERVEQMWENGERRWCVNLGKENSLLTFTCFKGEFFLFEKMGDMQNSENAH